MPLANTGSSGVLAGRDLHSRPYKGEMDGKEDDPNGVSDIWRDSNTATYVCRGSEGTREKGSCGEKLLAKVC